MKAEAAVAVLVVALVFGAFSPALFLAVVAFGLLWAVLNWIGGRW